MLCPICDGIALREVEKNGVLIDICPSCKGVWLDRGELDKLMQDVHAAHQEYDQLQAYAASQQRQSHRQPSPPPYQAAPYPPTSHGYHPHYKDNYKYNKNVKYDKYGRPYRKKKSVFNMLEDLFD
ncbi:zf-TFIIB domain-containing protein [Paenibacillus camelliae]|uniref:TFIIB-type zinc ribbon-containing protein n=1 Tax=Paenibacillus camelliae TaxID=512410 RepID=UPI00203FE025|nr:zf-TFIIB domain-containing protein [Paenibacillus camelliae]MCM3632293.1 zf-TFIIB domain-containing protein [Paenibacillus camelliae]